MAPSSDTLRVRRLDAMPRSQRDRISVDLRGLRAALCARARVLGLSPSDLVRRLLADALDEAVPPIPTIFRRTAVSDDSPVRLSLRMAQHDAQAVRTAAKRAGLSCGAYIADLVSGIPALLEGSAPKQYLAALSVSSAEMSSLARDLRHLTSLLRRGSIRAAQEYRERLDAVAEDVREHLMLASAVLSALQPRRDCPSRHPDRSLPIEGEQP
jgi:hypothetical protein